jgi:phage-related protein
MYKSFWDIEYYRLMNGDCPIKQFINDQEENVKEKILFDLRLIAEQKIITKYRFCKVDSKNGIWETRTKYGGNIYRIFGFIHKNKLIILTNGYQKKSQKLSKQDLERAIKYKKDYIERENNG